MVLLSGLGGKYVLFYSNCNIYVTVLSFSSYNIPKGLYSIYCCIYYHLFFPRRVSGYRFLWLTALLGFQN